MNKTRARLSREITLPRRLLTTDSLPEAARSLLAQLGQIAPGFLRGWVGFSGQSGTRLTPLASHERSARAASTAFCRKDSLLPTDKETALLYQAYFQGRSRSNVLAASSSGRPDASACPDNGAERYFVFPLRNRRETVGAVLLRYEGPGPDASERALIKQTAGAAVNLLINLQRDALFKTLERSKQHWEATFDALDALLYIHSPAGELLKVNRALSERLGIAAPELLRRPELLFAHFPLCSAASHAETNFWRSTALQATFETTVTPVYDRSGQLIGCVHILRDVSDRLRMEEQLRRNERLAALGEMFSGIAHELNNPLTSILWYAERLCRTQAGDPLPLDRVQDITRKIGLETERAAHIVQDLLSFARPHQHEKTALSLNDLVERTVDLSSASRDGNSIELRLCLADSLPPIEGNFFDLQRVVLNLIQNAQQAILYHQARGCITIATRALDNGIALIVSDNGPGISPEHRARVLDPFFTTKPVGQGTGLGLSICYGILQAHQAALNIESEEGCGASFHITFPACPVIGSEDVRDRTAGASDDLAPDSPAGALTHNPSAFRIGLVDDEPLIRDTLMEILEEAGYRVRSFASPEHALDALKAEKFDLLISDLKMPTMTGMQFYEQIQSLFPDMADRMLFISGDVISSAANSFFARTARPVLKKPFRSAEILGRLAELLQTPGP